ncbi:MAG: hypothetical protein NTU47_13130 [Ignavibacteriales bacterium]|nr:hypothetical protein [Ignavibacteriales bacterium]
MPKQRRLWERITGPHAGLDQELILFRRLLSSKKIADETQYWLELLLEQIPIRAGEITGLIEEAKELTAIFTASGKTAKRKT